MAITLNGSTGITTDIDGDESLTLNRDTSDGNIITLQKDNTTVGSIGAKNGDVYISGVTANSGFRFYDTNPALTPCSTDGSDSDASLSLGVSSVRWKNLYLSGGVYVGGTGSANHLDDYEEGTWTPVYSADSGTPTSNANIGYYRKIGNMVNISFFISGGSNGASGTLVITGLPFTAINVSNGYGTGHTAIYGMTWAWTNAPASIYAKKNTSQLGMWDAGTNAQVVSDMSSSGNNLECSLTYMTNS